MLHHRSLRLSRGRVLCYRVVQRIRLKVIVLGSRPWRECTRGSSRGSSNQVSAQSLVVRQRSFSSELIVSHLLLWMELTMLDHYSISWCSSEAPTRLGARSRFPRRDRWLLTMRITF